MVGKNKRRRFFILFASFIYLLSSFKLNAADDIPAKQTMDTFVNYMWSAISGTESGAVPLGLDKQATSVFMCYPGIPLDPSTLDGMVSSINPQGNIAPLEYFSSKMLDVIPDVSKYVWSPTTSKVSGAYSLIIKGANATSSNFSEEEKKNYETARKILYVEKPSLFPNKPPSQVKSDPYIEYEQKRNAHQNAVSNFNAIKFTFDLSKPEEQRKWLAQAFSLQNNVDNSRSDWITSNKEDIEQAISIMGSTLKNGLGSEIIRCGKVFDTTELASLLPGGAPWHPVWTVPEQWWKDVNNNWTHVDISSKKSYDHIEKHTRSYGGGGGFSFGLFSIGGSYGSSTEHNEEQHTSSNLALSMDFSTVLLQRDWLNTDWMKSETWYLKGSRAGKISSGTFKNNANDNILPTVPVSMIVGKNIKLTADWSNTTSDYFKKSISSNASVGYGPFSISGHYQQGDENKNIASQFDGKTLTVGGIQILGFVCAVPPKSSPLSDPSM